MEPAGDPRLRRLLRILRNPFISPVVLYNLEFYVHWSGNAYIHTFAFGPALPLILAPGPMLPTVTGVFIIGNLLLVVLTYAHAVERRSAGELSTAGMGRELGIGLFTACVLTAMAPGVCRLEGIDGWRNLVAGVTAER